MEDTGGFLYYRPRTGSMKRICVSGDGAVFKYRKSNEEVLPKEEVEVKPSNLSGKVISLFDQSLSLLAGLTHCFESLVDFPEEFGQKIFNKAMTSLTTDCEETSRSLVTFSEAYPGLLLPSCSLSHSLLLVNHYEMSLPSLLSATTKLDLSHCHLGDSHDLLGHLAVLECLEVLCLSHNHLSDLGLRRLLLPCTLRSLRYLDWSGNKLEMKSINRLGKMVNLESVVVLETDLAGNQFGKAFCGHFRRVTCPAIKHILTEGFASQLLEMWRHTSQPKKHGVRNGSFYRKKLHRTEADEVTQNIAGTGVLLQNTTGIHTGIESIARTENKVMFRRDSKIVENGEKVKRKFSSEESHMSKRRKIECGSVAVTEFEQSLLDLYR